MERIDESPLTAEEKANLDLLEITDGILTGVTDEEKLVGSLVIPDSVTEIAQQALFCCKALTRIIIPSSVTKIGPGAIACCTGLTGIVIPNSITTIDKYAFAYCSSLTGVVIPDSVTVIGAANVPI